MRELVLSPDGQWLYSANANKTIKIWRLADTPKLPPSAATTAT
jgi:WD40 repeat protein